MYHCEVLPENVTEYFMRQLVHVVFQLTGSAVAIPAAAAAAVAAHHRLEVSGFLPGTHCYDAVHSETRKPLCHQQAALFPQARSSCGDTTSENKSRFLYQYFSPANH